VTGLLGGRWLCCSAPLESYTEIADAIELHVLARERGISLAPGPLFSADHRFAHCPRG